MTELILDRTKPTPVDPKTLDAEQLRVVAHRKGAMRVLAGPGTGKTTTLVAAMADRLTGDAKLQPDQVLGLTFGRRAALDWRSRVTLAVGGGLIPQISTFHSFCYGLLRKYDPAIAAEVGIRLLSGPEQQVRVRELFLGALADGTISLPAEYAQAQNTSGLIEEIRAVMSRTRSHLMGPTELERLGQSVGRPMWELIGRFLETYLENIESEQALDYAEVIYRATELLTENDELALKIQNQYHAIFVDEYQDTDSGQVALLKLLVNADTTLTAVGDVDQAIYGFRGADEKGIGKFKDDFSDIYGSSIDADVALKNCWRFGANIRNAAQAVIGSKLPAGFSADLISSHRSLNCKSDGGVVELKTFDSEGAQAAHLADLIARAKSQDNYRWSDIAVIVRSATNSLPIIYRALVAAGIPAEVAADEIPLHLDPAIAPIISFLEVIAQPKKLTFDVAYALATGPIGQIDSVDLRRFLHELRKQEQVADTVARPSGELLVSAITEPGDLLVVSNPRFATVVKDLQRISKLITDCRNDSAKGKSAHEILWQVWQGSSWPQTLLKAALGTGSASVRANRDLDAICSLFDQANRFTSQNRAPGIRVFLEEIMAQEIPAEALADNQVRSDTVRLLTAHRAKGLEWPVVFIVGAQEDVWPDLRMRQTLLQADRIGRNEELLPTTTSEALLAERRLFYVALTRAKDRVVITAVLEDGADDGQAPSRFMEELRESPAVLTDEKLSGRPHRALTSDGIVAQLRRILADPESSPDLQAAVASRLAKLSATKFKSLQSANPDNWWGILPRTENEKVRQTEPVDLSATKISDLEKCPAQWYLQRQVSAVAQTQNHLVFGTILHSFAQGLENGELSADSAALESELDKIWPAMPYEANWIRQKELAEAKLAANRLLNWFKANSQVRSIAESSLEYEAVISTQNSDGTSREIAVKITGSADRIQFDADGVVVYDYKTSRNPAEKLEENVQLALYSFLIENGQFKNDEQFQKLAQGDSVKASALINLRIPDATDDSMPNIQQVANGTHDNASDVPLSERIFQAAEIVLDERYEFKPSDKVCRTCPVKILCPEFAQGREVV